MSPMLLRVLRSCAILLCLLAIPASVRAQEPVAEARPEVRELSEAERIVKLEQAVEASQGRQAKLRGERALKKDEFTKLSARLKEVSAELEDVKRALEAADPNAAGDLSQRLERLQQVYALVRTQADLALQAERTLAQQIVRVDEQLAQDSRALEKLHGPESDDPQEAESAVATEVVERQAPTPEDVVRQETPEQIEARREAERTAADAKEAEKAIVEYVDRKKALKDQIVLDQKLIDTDEQSRDNAFDLLHAREAELEAGIVADAPPAELRGLHQDVRQIGERIEMLGGLIEDRTDDLAGLHEQLHALQDEQLLVVEEARRMREEAEAARRRSVWLESPLHPANLSQWAVTRGPSIAVMLMTIVVLFMAAKWGAGRLAKLVVRPTHRAESEQAKRAETIAVSFGGATRIVIVLVGGLMVLEEAGVDIRTVLGGAAVIGLAVAFGAQNLMRDYFSGFMVLLEDQYELGDLVTIDTVTGTVERANMRTTVLRDIEGRVHFIPNGQITRVTNRSYGWSQAVFEIQVAYNEDVDRVMALLLEVGRELRKDEAWSRDVTAEPVMMGVDAFGEQAVTIKFALKTKPGRMFPVRREMLRRIKNRFDQEGIEIPVPKRMLVEQSPS
jgi:small conductance mechanosensitive channel